MQFEYISPGKIIFGPGASSTVGRHAEPLGGKPLVVYGKSSLKEGGHLGKILDSLKASGLEPVEHGGLSGEPGPGTVDALALHAAEESVDCVIAVGGGGVIDAAKAAAALAVNEKGVENYLEGVGRGFVVERDPLPFLALPTTAGAGAEATKNAVITSHGKRYKKSFRDDRLLARAVIVDPELMLSLPPDVTAASGMDAVCQLLEALVSKKRAPFPSALAEYHLPLAVAALRRLRESPRDLEARSVMAASALASGLALANAGLGAVHGFASGLGGAYDIPHGLICAILLPHVVRLNAARKPEPFRRIAGLLGLGSPSDLADYFAALNDYLSIPGDFSSFGIPRESAGGIVQLSQGSSMSGNPVDFSGDELEEFIRGLL